MEDGSHAFYIQRKGYCNVKLKRSALMVVSSSLVGCYNLCCDGRVTYVERILYVGVSSHLNSCAAANHKTCSVQAEILFFDALIVDE